MIMMEEIPHDSFGKWEDSEENGMMDDPMGGVVPNACLATPG